jgi:hypothetical protein
MDFLGFNFLGLYKKNDVWYRNDMYYIGISSPDFEKRKKVRIFLLYLVFFFSFLLSAVNSKNSICYSSIFETACSQFPMESKSME